MSLPWSMHAKSTHEESITTNNEELIEEILNYKTINMKKEESIVLCMKLKAIHKAKIQSELSATVSDQVDEEIHCIVK